MKSIILSKWSLWFFSIVMLSILSCNNDKTTEETESDTTKVSSDTLMPSMRDTMVPAPFVGHAEAVLAATYPDTALSGSVKFDTVNGKVKMVFEVTVTAKANKEVAVHLHEHGDCGDSGKMAHGHWNPTNAQHGKWGSASFHVGDIGNVKLDAKGKGTLTLETDLWSLGGTPDKNIIGKAVIVHGGTDDYTTQPTGNAGSRIGCGVIQ